MRRAAELELEQRGVVAGADEHGLVAQRDAALVALEDAGADLGGLVGLVGAGDERRPRARAAARSAAPCRAARSRGMAAMTALAVARISGVDRWLSSSSDDVGAEPVGELEDVPHRRRPEAVDRLGVVADRGEAQPVRRASSHERSSTSAWSALVSWYSSTRTWSNRAAIGRGDVAVGEQRRPVQQEVVVVEDLGGALAGGVGGEGGDEVVALLLAPREVPLEDGAHAASPC